MAVMMMIGVIVMALVHEQVRVLFIFYWEERERGGDLLKYSVVLFSLFNL